MPKSRLQPATQRRCKKKIYGFDIETHGKKNEFLCAAIYLDHDKYWFFDDIEELKLFLRSHRFRNSIIVASNLSFDFFGTFEQKDLQDCKILFQGSNLLYAKIPITKTKLKNGKTQTKYVTFLDTYNYIRLSVKKMGGMLKIPKLNIKEIIGKQPKNKDEWARLKAYNIRDAEVSKRFLEFLYEGFEELGATPKNTIASTSMSIFRNKYLKKTYFPHNEETSLEILKGYYGGRTEVFKRGIIENHKMYDVNSLYPAMMEKNIFPDPNTKRLSYENTLEYIKTYEGMSKVSVSLPIQHTHPLLPVKLKTGKLIFPTGSFTGWYCHNELRKALSIGYTITRVHKTHYYKKNCIPFKEFVNDLYGVRLKYKEQKDKRELVTKLFLNSLYGKFAQKFKDRENFIPTSQLTYKHTQTCSLIEPVNENFVKIKESTDIAGFHFPIWAAYITSYGRIHMWDLITESDSAYTDTDCIVTKKEMLEGEGLGELKKELTISRGVIIRPKFYGFKDDNNNSIIKVKGIGCLVDDLIFTNMIKGLPVTYPKFVKFKESIRRGLKVNEIIDVTKELSLEDDKRDWCGAKFNPLELQLSIPIHLKEEPKDLNICINDNIQYEPTRRIIQRTRSV